MTPLSITLRNFLCYSAQEDGSPYVFNFREHRLWSICGDNGAGKSAIFDAITYCLYGQHRGGNSHDEELLHRGATELLACVEFEQGGREYRVTRTIRLGLRPRKGTPTVQRDCHMEWLRDDGEWLDVAETSSVRGLEEAVKKILGFGCETLTASVLLLQGKSDRLIDAGGKGRFDILSGILDLSRYEQLATRARELAKEAKDQQRQLQSVLDQAPPPEAAEVEAAESAAKEAGQLAEAAVGAKGTAEQTLAAATEYWSRQDRLTVLHAEEAEMVEALKDAPSITAQAKEAEDLTTTLPRLRQAFEAERGAGSKDAQAAETGKAAAKVDVVKADQAVEKAKKALAVARHQHGEVRRQIADANAKLGQIAPEVSAATELERLESQIQLTTGEVAELQAKCLGIDEVRSNVERLRKLKVAKSHLTGYREAREAIAAAEQAAQDGNPDAELGRRQALREQLVAAARDAANSESEAEKRLAGIEAERRGAEKTVAEREEAGEEGTCTHCGQPVPASHIQKQIAEARRLLANAKLLHSEAGRKALEATEHRLAADAEVLKAAFTESQAADCAKAANDARATLDELRESEEFADLPEDVRDLLQGPLADLKSNLAQLLDAPSGLAMAVEELDRVDAISASATAKGGLIHGWAIDVSNILEDSSRVRLAQVHERNRRLQQQLITLQKREEKMRPVEDAAQASITSRQAELNAVREKKRELEESARLLGQVAIGFRQEARAALTGVGEQFQPVTADVIEATEAQLAELEGAAERLVLLRKAESDLVGLRGQIKELVALVDLTPQAHRAPLAEATGTLTLAEGHAREMLETAQAKRGAADDVKRTRTERLQSQAEAQRLAMTRAVWDRVGQLLGRGGIQTALMRSALEDIQERANTMLNRMSGGQLQLAISCEQTARGEEIYLRCMDAASAEQPLDLEFLSGGQRFRCAVALAAGIGQRAGSEGSMPSQIIDEGFGSLDAQGRTEMLEEIRQMSEFYERVIVVSHMDSFHDQALFPARYELRKDGRRTVVTAVG